MKNQIISSQTAVIEKTMTVSAFLHNHDINPMKKQKHSERFLSRAADIASEVNQSSVTKVAAKYGISKQAISETLKNAGYVHLYIKQEYK
jgi:hypothetical protein